MKTKIQILVTATMLFAACQNGTQHQAEEKDQNKVAAPEKLSIAAKEKLTGKWIQPIPGPPSECGVTLLESKRPVRAWILL